MNPSPFLLIGERINGTRESIAKALIERDAEFIKKEAFLQLSAGANILDLNSGRKGAEETEDLKWLIKILQKENINSFCLDSPNPEAIKDALKICQQSAQILINSITLEKGRQEKILPLVKKYNCSVVGLLLDEKGIPQNLKDRIKIAEGLIKKIKEYKIPLNKLYLDPLVEPVSLDTKKAIIVLETMEKIKKKFPEVKILLGLSNISFGLPNRSLINRTFLTLAIQHKVDALIIDPLDKALMSNLRATALLLNLDPYAQEYINSFRQGKLI